MPVAGLTLTLHHDTQLAAGAVEEMRHKPGIEIGKGNGRWLAAVIDCEDQSGCRDLHRWIESLPGVDFADVVYVAFDEPDDEEPATERTLEKTFIPSH